MKADKELLIAIANKLQEISEKCSDFDTQEELDEFISVIFDSIR